MELKRAALSGREETSVLPPGVTPVGSDNSWSSPERPPTLGPLFPSNVLWQQGPFIFVLAAGCQLLAGQVPLPSAYVPHLNLDFIPSLSTWNNNVINPSLLWSMLFLYLAY